MKLKTENIMTEDGILTAVIPTNIKECAEIGFCLYCRLYDDSIQRKDCIAKKKFTIEAHKMVEKLSTRWT